MPAASGRYVGRKIIARTGTTESRKNEKKGVFITGNSFIFQVPSISYVRLI